MIFPPAFVEPMRATAAAPASYYYPRRGWNELTRPSDSSTSLRPARAQLGGFFIGPNQKET